MNTKSLVSLTATVAGIALAGLAVMHGRPAADAVAAPAAARQAAAVHPATPATATCTRPAPTGTAGYTRMFASIPVSQWGGADVSISVPLPDGRVVWLYGDTLSTKRFVHSTGIVQDRGCLHVSHGGAQLLPNQDATHIYWIEAAHAVSGGVAVTARGITLTGKGPWDFADAGFSRTALVTVSPTGDLTFVRWTATARRPILPTTPLTQVGPHHYTYAMHTHPEAKLASGRTLTTTCQNWDDKIHPLTDYRPLFSEIIS